MWNARILNLGLIDLNRVILQVEVDLDLANSKLLVILGNIDIFLEVTRKVQHFAIESNPSWCRFTLSDGKYRVELLLLTFKMNVINRSKPNLLTWKWLATDTRLELAYSHGHIVACVKMMTLKRKLAFVSLNTVRAV